MKDINCDMQSLAREIGDLFKKSNATTLDAYFTVGDKVLAAMAATGLSETDLTDRLAKEIKYTVCAGTIRVASTMARVFTKVQRRTALDIGLPVYKAQALCHSMYDDSRGRVLTNIKIGRITWSTISTPGQEEFKKRRVALATGMAPEYVNNPRKILIDLDDEDRIVDGLSRLMQSTGTRFPDYLEKAHRKVEKSEGWNPRKVAI